MTPYLMKVGKGFNFSRRWLFDSRIELGVLPGVGLTYAYLPELDWAKFRSLKLKLIIFVLGGAIANCILLLFTVITYTYSQFSITWYFSFIEVFTIISTLIPMNVRLYGVSHANDGKMIFMILTQDYRKYYEGVFADYQKNIARYIGDGGQLRDIFNNDIRSLQILMEAYTELASQHFDKAASRLGHLLNNENNTDSERAYLLDVLSSIVINHGQKQYLSQADRWSQEAMELASYSKTIQGTRGVILVELGKYEEGKHMLLPLTEPENNPIDIAISSYYLAKVANHLGNGVQAQKWLKQAKEAGIQVPGLPEMFTPIEQELQKSIELKLSG